MLEPLGTLKRQMIVNTEKERTSHERMVVNMLGYSWQVASYLKLWFGVRRAISHPTTSCLKAETLAGFPFSFGVFQSYYTTHPPFAQHPTGIAVIGTCSTGIMYLFAPISLHALEAWPSVHRLSSVVGLIIIVSALIASSFSTRVWHLILTQGVLYAIGGSLLYSPTMFYLDEWFVKRKGLAFGIMWAGVGT